MATSTMLPPIASGFVRKLYSILNGNHASIICWNELGTAFSVLDFELLVERVLPLYFRGRLDAFRQQLREHGFQRVAASGLLVARPGAVETYRHAHFLRGNPNELSFIVRTPLPRKRTRRKKPGVTVKVEVKTEEVPYSDPVKAEPLPLEPMDTSPAAKVLQDLEIISAGNSTNPLFTDDERFDILQWLELPAVDAQASLSSSYGSMDELDLLLADAECEGNTLDRGVEQLTEDQLEMFMRLLASPASVGECTHTHATKSSAVPASATYVRSPLWDGHQFSEDTLFSMMECFSTVPT